MTNIGMPCIPSLLLRISITTSASSPHCTAPPHHTTAQPLALRLDLKVATADERQKQTFPVCFSLISSVAERGLLVPPWNYSDGAEEKEGVGER